MEKNFPNGFRSWMEAHHEVVSYITQLFVAPNLENAWTKMGLVEYLKKNGDLSALYAIAEGITDQFEENNLGRERDGEFLKEVRKFASLKVYELYEKIGR